MNKITLALCAVVLAACGGKSGPQYRVYISNEASGDLTVIDPTNMEAVETVASGKRARGIHPSVDGKQIFVALSGSPFAPPGVDESTLPPPDKSADGIGIFDIAQNKMLAQSARRLRSRAVRGGPRRHAVRFERGRGGRELRQSRYRAQCFTTIPTGEEPEGVMLTPDGKFVYVTSEHDGTVTVVDIAAAKAVKTIKVGRRPRGIAFCRMGPRPTSTNENDATISVIDTGTLEATHTIADRRRHQAHGRSDVARWLAALRHHRAGKKVADHRAGDGEDPGIF